MERLTEKHYAKSDCYINCSGNCTADLKCEDCINLQTVINRLGSYEDTGLTPEQIPRWISVADQLPEHNQRVIVCRKDGRVEQGFYLGVNGWWKVYGTNTKSITHWMPMPEPPEEG